MAKYSKSTVLEIDGLVQGIDNTTNEILDYKPSSRYHITLEIARDRALRAIKNNGNRT
jgi:hypothetical protein